MEPTQAAVLILCSGTGAVVFTKILDWLRDSVAGRASSRRAEVDRAIQERDVARAREVAALAAETSEARWSRVLEESLLVHRRLLIDNGIDRPDYPNRPDKE